MPLMSTEFYFFQYHWDPTTAFYYHHHHEKVIKYRRISITSHPSMSTFRNRSVSFEVRRVHTWRSVKSHSHSFPQYRASRTRVLLQPLAHQSRIPSYSKTEANHTVWSLTFPPSQYHSTAELSSQIQKVTIQTILRSVSRRFMRTEKARCSKRIRTLAERWIVQRFEKKEEGLTF